MYELLGEAVETALALKPLVANGNHCEVIIAPVFVHLKTLADSLEGSNIKIAAQVRLKQSFPRTRARFPPRCSK